MLRPIPRDVQEPNWHDFVQDQSKEHRVGHIREEIVDAAVATAFERYCLRKKLFEFSGECCRVAWLRLFNWVFSRLDPCCKQDTTGRMMHLMVDVEPHASPIDPWVFGNVSQTFVQKSLPSAFISEFSSVAATATKPPNKIIRKERAKKSRSCINEEKELKEMKEQVTTLQRKAARAHGIVDESKKANGYPKKNNNSSSLHEQLNVDLSAGRREDNFDKRNKADLFPKIMKERGDNNSNKKQREIKDTRRWSKNPQLDETKVLLRRKEAATTIPVLPRQISDRIEIVSYTISPERDKCVSTETFQAKTSEISTSK